MTNKTTGHKLWLDLSFGDLEEWVGATYLARGRDYQRKRRVLLLACSSAGVLSAQVAGGALYYTVVERDAAGNLSSTCSCPLGGDCKHAVAVVLEYLERVKAGKEVPSEVPPPPPARPAWAGDDFETDDDELLEPEPPKRKSTRGSGKAKPVSLEEYLHGLPGPELVSLVLELADAFSEVERLLKGRANLASGEVGALVRGFRNELARVSAEPAWRNSWTGEGNTPDYGLVRKYLEGLLAAGQADLVLQLGAEVLAAGTQQMGMADDEGDTGYQVATALQPVWEALGRSSLTPAKRILWLYEVSLKDEYALCDGVAAKADIWAAGPEAWSEVADALVERLGTAALKVVRGDDFGARHRRAEAAGWAIDALQRAGREQQAVELAVGEARLTESYERAVDLLIKVGRRDEARALAFEGIAATQAQFPGIAAHLRTRLRELAKRGRDRALEAAFVAEEFFLHPTLEGYRDLRRTAQRLDVWEAVREQTLPALATGACPLEHEGWPLPDTGTAPDQERGRWRGPFPSLLTEIALDEADLEAALRWYRECASSRSPWGASGLGDEVARAVAPTHPDEAIAIWRGLAEQCIAGGNRSAYQASLQYLRPMQRLLVESGRTEDWDTYLAALREENRRRRALLETLDSLRRGPIIGDR